MNGAVVFVSVFILYFSYLVASETVFLFPLRRCVIFHMLIYGISFLFQTHTYAEIRIHVCDVFTTSHTITAQLLR